MSEPGPETANNGGAIVESVLPGETATAGAAPPRAK